MHFSLLVSCPPSPDPTADKALQFATALLAAGHHLYRVFFVAEGVNVAATLAESGDQHASEGWAQLQHNHNLDLVVCITDYQQRFGKASCNPAFTLSGMGQLADASHHSERVVSFR